MVRNLNFILLILIVVGCKNDPVTLTGRGPSSDPQLGSAATLPTSTLAGSFSAVYTVKEGSPLDVTVSATGGVGTYKYSFDYNGDGTYEVVDSPSNTVKIPASYFPDGPALKSIGGKVADQSGTAKTFTGSVSVTNVNPTIFLSAPAWGAPGSTLSFNVSPSDVSPNDHSSGYTYLWNFGDGVTGNLKSLTHVYSIAKTYNGTLKVTDKDGGSVTSAFSVIVSTVQPPTAGCLLSGNYIVTPYDKIPNFIISPTVRSIKSGNWSDVTVWSTGIVPNVSTDRVSIDSGHTVVFDRMMVSPDYIGTVGIQFGGKLTFKTDIDTSLIVQNFLVLEGGELEIGTQSTPILSSKKAQVIFANKPMDMISDPEQFGNGLIACGSVTIHGDPKDSFVRVSANTPTSMPKKNDTSLQLTTAPLGWNSGDSLVIPDTRQLHDSFTLNGVPYVPQWERGKFNVTGATSVDLIPGSLTANGVGGYSAFQYDHKCALDASGNVDLCPHVGNLTRNVVIRSESATGSFLYPPNTGNKYYTRGHIMFTMRAKVDIRYAQFSGLGRSVMPPLGTGDLSPAWDTVFSSTGTATLGTNQSNRLPVSFRHVWGSTSASPGNYQFVFQGNSVFCPIEPMPFVWGLAVRDSHYGLIKDNILFNWAGAGMVFLDGNESFNVVEHNFSLANRGDFTPRTPYLSFGTADSNPYYGVNYWFNGFNNYIRNNIAANATSSPQGIVAGAGFDIKWSSATNSNTPIPLYPGADMQNANQIQKVNMQARNILEFSGNEAYGAMATAFVGWYWLTSGSLGLNPSYPGVPANLIKGFTAWHFSEEGFFSYSVNNVVFDGLKLRGDPNQLNSTYAVGWTSGDYWAGDTTIKNADISGLKYGINRSSDVHGFFRIQDSILQKNKTHILVPMYMVSGARVPATSSETYIDNVLFSPLPSINSNNGNAIYMEYAISPNAVWYVSPDNVYVTKFNGVTGDDFQVYYKEQASNFIVPVTTYYGPDANNDGIGDWIDNYGACAPGLTNAQCWVQCGTAIGGSVAPSTAVLRPGIFGLVK